MKIYLVGGAVRDFLLGRPVIERDWVVVGATPQEMEALGYRPVGKDFPVFLHPVTQEEYALARTERKVGKGYKGFSIYADPKVTLAEDLIRRDLTINAIAKDENGQLIDPYHGQEDLKARLLRHVSPAFAEDPVRILRVARFAARLPEFSVHPSTVQLMREMVENGEVNALVAERVWRELERALAEEQPQRFFEILDECGARAVLFPEITDICLLNLRLVSNKLQRNDLRFAGLLYSLDAKLIKQLGDRLRVPKQDLSLAMITARYHEQFERALSLNAESLLATLQAVDSLRNFSRFKDFLSVCAAMSDVRADEKRERLLKAHQIILQADTKAIADKGYTGQDFADALREERIQLLESLLPP